MSCQKKVCQNLDEKSYRIQLFFYHLLWDLEICILQLLNTLSILWKLEKYIIIYYSIVFYYFYHYHVLSISFKDALASL